MGWTETLRYKEFTRPRDERTLRVETAAVYRSLGHFGMDDLIDGHTSCRLPGEPFRYLIKPYNITYDSVTASNLVTVDINGTVISEKQSGATPSPFGFAIHSAIQKARPDAKVVIHVHSRYGMAVAALRDGLLPLNQINMKFHNRLAYYDLEKLHVGVPGDEEMTAEDDEQQRLAAALGDKNCMIMRHHGLVAVGETPARAFHRMYYLEQACRIQMDVLQSTAPYDLPSEAVCEAIAVQEETDARPLEQSALEAMMARLDRIDASYRN